MLFLTLFVLAALADVLTVHWHRLRESGRPWATSLASMGLEMLSWIPLWFALTLDDWSLALASILGSGVGTRLGFRNEKRDPEEGPVE